MPKLERLEWIAPLSEGRGVTLSDDPAADLFLAEEPNALLLGVLYDSQFSTRRAFSAPLRLKERLGHFDMTRLATDDEVLRAAFAQKPALHRFPNKFAGLTQQFAVGIIEVYGGDGSRVWSEARDVADLAGRLLALPSFGVEKTTWTVRMLGRLQLIPYGGWEDFHATVSRVPKRNG